MIPPVAQYRGLLAGESDLSHIQCSCFDTIRPVVRANDIGPCGHWSADSSFEVLFVVVNAQW